MAKIFTDLDLQKGVTVVQRTLEVHCKQSQVTHLHLHIYLFLEVITRQMKLLSLLPQKQRAVGLKLPALQSRPAVMNQELHVYEGSLRQVSRVNS